jgi:hypothetical protein
VLFNVFDSAVLLVFDVINAGTRKLLGVRALGRARLG